MTKIILVTHREKQNLYHLNILVFVDLNVFGKLLEHIRILFRQNYFKMKNTFRLFTLGILRELFKKIEQYENTYPLLESVAGLIFSKLLLYSEHMFDKCKDLVFLICFF